jgi:protein subunit release factor A
MVALERKSMTELQRRVYSFEKLLAKFERCKSPLDLAIYAAEAMTAAEEDKPKLREVYARKKREFAESSTRTEETEQSALHPADPLATKTTPSDFNSDSEVPPHSGRLRAP